MFTLQRSWLFILELPSYSEQPACCHRGCPMASGAFRLYHATERELSAVPDAQVTLILGAALLFWVARTPSSESSYSGYGAF